METNGTALNLQGFRKRECTKENEKKHILLVKKRKIAYKNLRKMQTCIKTSGCFSENDLFSNGQRDAESDISRECFSYLHEKARHKIQNCFRRAASKIRPQGAYRMQL